MEMVKENASQSSSRSIDELMELRERSKELKNKDVEHWIRENELSVEELAMLSNASKLNQTAIGKEIPLFPLDVAALPTELSRTALFQVRQRGKRKVYLWETLASRSDIQIQYFGVELDNGIDQELWILALSLARGTKTGTRIWITLQGLLLALGRSTGGKAKRNLKLALDRLASATLRIQFQRNGKNYKFTTSLLNWGIEEETGRMFIRVDPDGQVLFENLSYLNFELHLALVGGVTKALHLYAIGHTRGKKHTQSLVNLKEWFGYKGSDKNFRDALFVALNQLKEKEVFSDWKQHKWQEKESITWTLNKRK